MRAGCRFTPSRALPIDLSMHAATPGQVFKVVWTGCVSLGSVLCLAMAVAGQFMYGLSALGVIAVVWAPALALAGTGLHWSLRRLAR